MRDDGFGTGFLLGILIGCGIGFAVIGGAYYLDDEKAVAAIRRRGYDVKALAAEKADDYWRAVAARRPVADPQPTAEILGGGK